MDIMSITVFVVIIYSVYVLIIDFARGSVGVGKFLLMYAGAMGLLVAVGVLAGCS